jgi:hypothetical protein
MKFFTNLPKTTFTSTVGDFIISDFFTYLDVDNTQVQEAAVPIDDKTTLVEAAATVYQDPNSLWAFVAASNTINPFTLLDINSFLFTKNTEDKINLTLLPSPTAVTGGTAFPSGSLIVPYSSNTGYTFTSGYTGDFDINGPFAVIEQTSFYDGNMVISGQVGGTQDFIVVGATSEHVTVLQKNFDGSFTWAGSYYTGNKKAYSNKVVYQTLSKDGKKIFKELVSSNPTIDEYLPISTPISGLTTYVPTTALDNVDDQVKEVQAYIPAQIGLIQSSFVTATYR